MNVFVWAGILGIESIDWLAVNHFYDGKKKLVDCPLDQHIGLDIDLTF